MSQNRDHVCLLALLDHLHYNPSEVHPMLNGKVVDAIVPSPDPTAIVPHCFIIYCGTYK